MEDKAVACYEKSAALGCRQAMFNLGYCHCYGRDIPVDYNQAFRWFLTAYINDQGLDLANYALMPLRIFSPCVTRYSLTTEMRFEECGNMHADDRTLLLSA